MNKIALITALLLSSSAMAGFNEGVGYFDKQQYSKAFEEFKPLADDGDERAQYYVSYLYLNGFGTPLNDSLALSYLKKSAEQKYEKALSLMGYLYDQGRILPQNKKKAIELYEEAAEMGDDDALLNLGIAYSTGDGVELDLEKALEYFEQISLFNKPLAGRYIGDFYIYRLKNNEYRSKAKDAYMISAISGDIGSFHSLGYWYQHGEGTKLEDAIKYYRYAASQSYAPSQYTLGALYANGTGVSRDIITAYAWISLAAAQMPEAAKAQKQLEQTMTMSDLDKARHKIFELQTTVIGKLESPLKGMTMKHFELKQSEENAKKVDDRRRRSSRRRRR